jgi:hypothetical protein
MKLTKEQIAHLYELSVQNFQTGCFECERLKQRMEKFFLKTGRRVASAVKTATLT